MDQFQPLFTIRVYSHFFKILNAGPRSIYLIKDFLRGYVLKTLVKEPGRGFVMRPTKVFAANLRNGAEFRLHINQLNAFVSFLERNYIRSTLYKIEYEPMYQPQKVFLKLKKHWVLHDYQEPIVDYLTEEIPVEDKTPTFVMAASRSKMVGIQTGRGKGITAMAAVAALGYRVLILVKPTFLEKWCGDVLEAYEISPKEIMTVRGGDQLRGIIDLAKEGLLTSKIIILSTRTHQNYINLFEREPNSEDSLSYGCDPENLCKLLKIGTVLMDEVHLEFFAVFKSFLNMHVPRSIGLSATLVNNNQFLEQMYEVVFPKASRYEGLEHHCYIKMYPISYRFKTPDKIRTTEWGSTIYSHTAFEKSLLHRHSTLVEYKKLIKYIIELGFIKDYKLGDKLAVFVSTIAMATEIVNYIKKEYPSFDTRRYVEDDPYENAIDPDIRVSTLGSMGTGIDIPKLRTVILTVNILSQQSNLQSSGRLRFLPDRDVKFYYLYCEDIPKHIEYHQQRIQTMRAKMLLVKDLNYPYQV